MIGGVNTAEIFEAVYRGESVYGPRPPWETNRPQSAFVQLAAQGRISGAVLEPGCGTGMTALHIAGSATSVTGFDIASTAVTIARKRSAERGVRVTFKVDDALDPAQVEGPFDTVVDCGTARMFEPAELAAYAAALHRLCRPGAQAYALAISDQGMRDLTALLAEDVLAPEGGGSTQLPDVGIDYISNGLAAHWKVDSVTDSAVDYILPQWGQMIQPHAWLYHLHRN
ncbi:MAG: hypothetical protein CSB46_00090 [Micrococcales bacterium]|nr:MAG: hypothetical protein CSB46_00090 [Micrococcales bacterium]